MDSISEDEHRLKTISIVVDTQVRLAVQGELPMHYHHRRIANSGLRSLAAAPALSDIMVPETYGHGELNRTQPRARNPGNSGELRDRAGSRRR